MSVLQLQGYVKGAARNPVNGKQAVDLRFQSRDITITLELTEPEFKELGLAMVSGGECVLMTIEVVR